MHAKIYFPYCLLHNTQEPKVVAKLENSHVEKELITVI